MVFADTGAFVARYIRDDQWHTQAIEGWKTLRRTGETCLTTSYVVAEAAKLIGREVSSALTAQRVLTWMSAPGLTIIRPTLELDLGAIDVMEKFADQRVSFVDCVSFALMRHRRIKRAFAFDRHFEIAGFELWPRRK